MMKVAVIFSSILALGLMSGPASGETASIYKWVDDEGVTNYAGLPPRDTAAEYAGIRLNRTDPQTLQARADGHANLDKAKAIRKGQEAEDTQREKLSRQDIADQRVKNCRLAQERLTTYSQARRLYRPTEDGEREYLSDDELDAARAEAITLVEEWCD